MKRQQFLRAAAAAALALGLAPAWAQAYPSKPVRVIIPFPPGGTLDLIGRMLAQKMSEQTGQTFVDREPRRAATASSAPTPWPRRRPTATRCCSTRPRSPPAR
jgi:hypothetical protein